MPIELCTLGTASGLPVQRRFGQTVVLTHGGPDEGERHLLLDAGDGASSLLARQGYDHRRLEAIFISHMHADHHAGLIQLIKTCMHVERRDDLLLLAPEEGIPAFQAFLEASYLFEEWLGFRIRWLPLTGLVERAIELPGGGTLRAHPNGHLAGARERVGREARLLGRPFAYESYSAVYEHAGCRVVYSGNLQGPRGMDEMAPFVEPCDLLITELAHVDPVELGRFLAGRDIHHTIVVHFHPQWESVPEAALRELILQGAGEQGLRGRLSLARDGERFGCLAASL